MIPYVYALIRFLSHHQHHDQNEIAEYLLNFTAYNADTSQYYGFGHLAIHGALQNASGTTFHGILGPNSFSSLKVAPKISLNVFN